MSVMSPNEQQKDISIDDDAELFALEELLSAAENDDKELEAQKAATIPANTVPRLREDSTFADAFSYALDELPVSKLKQAQAEYSKKVDDIDSSDDEEIKNFLERKYNEYGSDINKKLKQQRVAKHEADVNREVAVLAGQVDDNKVYTEEPLNSNQLNWHIKTPHNPIKRHSLVSSSFKSAPPTNARNIATTPSSDSSQARASNKPFNSLTNGSTVFTDPVFGLRIINPLVSSALLVERMSGRKAIPFSGIAFHTQRGDLTKDWVIAGVLVKKNPIKLTKKGDPYSIWRVSDLKGEIKMISLFLFKGAHKELWKTATGICLAILNPTVFEQRAESGDAACLSIDTTQKVMILGQSKDMGICKAKKKSGEPCTAIINIGDCDYCIFHMKQEFGRMSQRSELQSANAGRGLNELRNKVLGKSEVFYGGQSFTAVPARKSAKQTAKDSNRIMSLSEYAVSPNAGSINHAAKQNSTATATIPYAARGGPVSKLATNVELSTKQRLKDLERLKILQAQDVAIAKAASEKQMPEPVKTATKSPSTPTTSKSDALKRRSSNSVTPSTPITPPQTSKTTTNATTFPPVPDKFKDKSFSFASPQLTRENFCIEVNIGDRKSQLAKLKAMQVLKKKPIQKINPNSTRGSADGKKRAIDDLNERFDSASKRQKIDEDQKEIDRKTRIQRIMDATSSHTNLIDMREQQERDQYFSKLEKKEALEEKMLNTYKIPCKAVICQQCKYTAFSAADHCKAEKHPLKIVDAEKRFFQCKDCGNRTATVFKLPKISCKNCKGSRWERTAMIRERKICDGSEGLSVRGDEETFIGSLAGKASLNLLVPDD